jgi:hypothetical protein
VGALVGASGLGPAAAAPYILSARTPAEAKAKIADAPVAGVRFVPGEP